MTQPRMRLLSVAVQARFVYDDGDTLTEVAGQPVSVGAGQWQEFAAGSFTAEDLERVREQFERERQSPPH